MIELVWATVAAGQLDDAARAALAADVDDARLARLQRFHRQQDRDRGLAAHALLRRELATLVGGHPAGLGLATRCLSCGSTEHGKPYLPGTPVEFNLSHSGDLVCVALAPAGVPVGVDVEQVRAVDWPALRRSVFDDAEWAASGTAPDPDAARTQIWARKEAAVKASGHGLALPLRRVRVTVDGASDGASDGAVDGVPGRLWAATLGDGGTAATGRDVRFEPGLGDAALDVPPHAAAVAVLATGRAASLQAVEIVLRHVVLD